MKWRFIGALALAASLGLGILACGCSSGGTSGAASGQASSTGAAGSVAAAVSGSSTASGGPASGGEGEPTNEYVAPSSHTYADADVDVDLTQMSGTAVYSAVYQMMVDPDSYKDKVVKMKGTYYSQYDEQNDKRYCFVIVQDATACCAQGLEFVWDDGEHAYPADYPAEGSEAIVCGKFGIYKEGNSKFASLFESSFELA